MCNGSSWRILPAAEVKLVVGWRVAAEADRVNLRK